MILPFIILYRRMGLRGEKRARSLGTLIGYIKIARADISAAELDRPRQSLEPALRLGREDPRALYYLAQVERRDQQDAPSINTLEQAVKTYPECRDELRELVNWASVLSARSHR